jgi:hypothetical protein
MSDSNPKTVKEKSTQETWENIVAIFKLKHGLNVRAVWFTGLSSRIHKNRLSKLRNSQQASQLISILKDLPSQKIKELRTFAAINQEQATAAFRMTLVGNITIPVGIMALAHQLLPNGLGASIINFYNDDMVALSILILAAVLATIFIFLIGAYALVNLNQARDIRHLIDLHAAERGIYFGLEDMDDLSLN